MGIPMTNDDAIFTVACDSRSELGESPVWHHDRLWWVDIMGGALHSLDPATGLTTSRFFGHDVSCAVPCRDGRWLIAQTRSLSHLDWETGALELAAEAELPSPDMRFNDGKCDPHGRFWVGTMDPQMRTGISSLYCFEAGGALRPVIEGATISNGLAWSADGTRFYYLDSMRKDVQVFEMDGTTVKSRGVLADFGGFEGIPDGMCIDADGNLWVASWAGGAVRCVDGQTGAILRVIEPPTNNPTCCCFGGPELGTLYVTSGWTAFGDQPREERPHSGSVFEVDVGVAGLPVDSFANG